MYRILCTVLAISIAFVANAQNESFSIKEFYPIENSHSYIEFSVKYMGYARVKGTFSDFEGTVRYIENDLLKTSVSLWIDANSIDTDNDWRDKDLKSDGWFDTEKYPNITFISKQVRPKGEGFEIIGDLTMKAVTKEVVIRMDPPSGVLKDTRGDSQVIFTGKTTLNRSEFGVEGKRWSAIKEGIAGVSDEISIEMSILGKQINESNFRNWLRDEKRPPGKIYHAISNNGVAAGLKIFDELLADTTAKINSNALILPGYMLLKEGKKEDALKVFKRVIEVFPDESNSYDSYAEALAESGKLTEAKFNYQKAFEMDPNNLNAKEILRHLK